MGAFSSVSNHVYGDSPFAIGSPSTSSGLPATLSIKSGPATIFGNTVTLTGVGTVTLAANQSGNANWNAAPEVTTSFVVSPASQTIGPFTPISNHVLGDASFSIGTPTASSGLAVTTSVKSGPATISGNTVTLTGVGTVTLAANQSGNANWNAAPEVTTSFVVKNYGQTIGSFSAIPDKFYGAAPFLITPPTATSKLPVAVTVKSGPATITNNKVTITGAGTVVLAANQTGNTSYAPAAEVTTSFTVYPANQTITLPSNQKPPDVAGIYPLPSFNSSAGLPVSFSVISGPAYISGTNYVVTAPGRVWVAVDQGGNSNYTAARQVSFYFDVGKSPQSISTNGVIITDIPGTYALPSIYSSAGLPVDVILISGPVRDAGYPYYTITGPGTVTVRLKQAGNDYYKPAPDLVVSFQVKLYDQTLYPFRAISDQTYGVAPFVVPAPLSSSGLPVTLTVKSGPARISNGLLTITGTGVVTLAANQAGNVSYNAAPESTISFTVSKASQVIGSLATIPSKTYGAAAFAVTVPKSTSGLAVSLSVLSGPAKFTGNTVTLTGAGVVTLAADQSGNANYLPASQITTTFQVNSANQTIAAFKTIANVNFTTTKLVTITPPAATSGLAVTVSVQSGPATISSDKVTLTGKGTVVLVANQAGNANYNAANPVTTSFSVN